MQDNNIVNNKVNNIVIGERENPTPEQILELFNTTCKSLAQAKYLTKSRREAIEAAVAKYSLAQITECFQTAESSLFLTGSNERKWKATFDWLIQEDNIAKVLEGNFNNDTVNTGEGKLGFDLDEFFKASLIRAEDSLE